MKIRTKLIISGTAAGVFLIIILLFNFIVLMLLSNMQHAADQRNRQAFLVSQAQGVQGDLYNIIANAEINRNIGAAQVDWKNHSQGAHLILEDIGKITSGTEQTVAIDRVKKTLKQMGDLFETQLVPLLKGKNPDQETQIMILNAQLDAYRSSILQNLKLILEKISQEATESSNVFTKTIQTSIFNGAIVGLVAILFSILTTFITMRSVLNPLRHQRGLLQNISEGEGDLTLTLDASKKDEFSDLAKYFNLFLEKLNGILCTVRDSTTQLEKTGGELSSNASQTAAALNQIAANNESVMLMINKQSTSIAETSASVEEINKNVNSFQNNVQMQGQEVEESAKEVSRLVSQIEDLNKKVEIAENLFTNLQKKSDEGRGTISAVVALIQEIAAKSDKLLEASKVISSVASQTNLLAMNAAIEAAHAGDAGQGFAVVADEIRKLAETTALRSRDIAQVLKDVKNQIDQMEKSGNASGSAFGMIADQIYHLSQLQDEIHQTLVAQTSSNRKTLKTFENIQNISAEIRTGSFEMAEGTKTILDAMTKLVEMSTEARLSMSEIAKGTSDINIAVHNLSDLSQTADQATKAVRLQTDRFKLRKEEIS